MDGHVNQTITTRAKTHGDFAQTAATAQAIKLTLRGAPNWAELTAVQREALDHIASKMARAVCGDANEPDHWVDIGGYAGLAERELTELLAALSETKVGGSVTPIGGHGA